MFTQLRNTVVSPVWSAKYDCLYKHFGWLLDCQAHFITNRKTNLKASHLETSCLSCQIDMRMCTCFCQILKNCICVCEREKKNWTRKKKKLDREHLRHEKSGENQLISLCAPDISCSAVLCFRKLQLTHILLFIYSFLVVMHTECVTLNRSVLN